MPLEPSKTNLLYTRLIHLHESSYLTLLSIVQGVATGFLATSIPKEIALNVECVLFLATFGFIILMWNEYIIGVASLNWIPTLSDAAIPFAFCLNEIILSRKLATPKHWFFGAAIFSFISFLAFKNMYTKAAQYCENDGVFKKIGSLKLISECFCLLATAIFLSFAFAERFLFDTFFPLLSIVVLILYTFRTYYYWRRVIEYAKSSLNKKKFPKFRRRWLHHITI